MAQSVQLLKVNHWHQRLADWLIANPNKKLREAADEFQRSQAWISAVINSDAFQDYFKRLSAQHSEALLVTIRDKSLAAADAAVGEIQRRLESSPETIPYNQLLETAEVLMKRAAPEVSSNPGPPNVQINLGVSQQELAEARAAMRQRQAPKGTLELDAKDITPPSQTGG
jgi:hypothetical protein